VILKKYNAVIFHPKTLKIWKHLYFKTWEV